MLRHRWDLLVTEPKLYRDRMDKDWTREDQKLEPEEEPPYADDHAEYITELTSKNEKKLIGKYSALVVNVRYPWCSQCKSQDDSFANAAKIALLKEEEAFQRFSAMCETRKQN